MKCLSPMPCLKGLRFSREVIAYAVWACDRFAHSAAAVEDLVADRLAADDMIAPMPRSAPHAAPIDRDDQQRGPRPLDPGCHEEGGGIAVEAELLEERDGDEDRDGACRQKHEIAPDHPPEAIKRRRKDAADGDPEGDRDQGAELF